MARGCDIAFITASGVMALKVTRSTGTPFRARLALKASTICQEIASPSRSGSVARIRPSAPLTDFAISETCLAPFASISHFMAKSCSGSTEPSFGGRSRTCPNEART